MKMFYHHDNIYQNPISASCINHIINIVCFINNNNNNNNNNNSYQHNDIQ